MLICISGLQYLCFPKTILFQKSQTPPDQMTQDLGVPGKHREC